MSHERQILEERARLLARPRTEATSRTSFAAFERGGVRYAIDPRFVFEVARAPRATALPRSDPHWLGITSLHGELIAVADLAVLLGAERSSSTHEDALLLVLGTETRELAFEIDAVLEPVSADVHRDRSPHDAVSHLIEGVTEDGLRVVRGDQLLSDPRLTMTSPENEA